MFKGAGKLFRRFVGKFRDLGAARILGDGDDLVLLVTLEIMLAEYASGSWRESEINLGTKMAGLVLQAEAEWRGALPVDQQQVVPAISVNVEHLNWL